MKIDQYCLQKLYNKEPYMVNMSGSLPLGPQNKTGHWSEKQNAKYYSFLKRFQEKFNEKQSRRQWKVFKALSSFIKTRNANQCRSHHHKMQRSFKTIEETLIYLSKKNPNIQSKAQRYADQLEEISKFLFIQDNELEIQKIEKEQNIQDNSKGWRESLFNKGFNEFIFSNKFEIENFKTCATYEIQQSIKYSQPSQFFANQPKLYASFRQNQLGYCPVNSQTTIQQTFEEPNYYKKSLLTNNSTNPMKNVQTYHQKLLECHNSFVLWYNKLQEMLRKQQILRGFQL